MTKTTEEKISIITDEISQDPDVVAEFLESQDINAVEIRTMAGARVPNIETGVWKDFKMHARNAGWKILALSPGTFKGDYTDEEKIGHEINVIFPDIIGQAIMVGAEFVITFGFMSHGDVDHHGYII